MDPKFFEDNINLENLHFDSLEEERDYCKQLGERFSLFNDSVTPPPSWLLKVNIVDHVVFYPGTFNPWHLGHRACLELCPATPIVVMPDFNPWKEEQDRQGPWQSLKNLVGRLEGTSFSIYPGFLSLDKGNPTVDWFPKVKIKNKGLLIGDDSFLNFHKWKDVDELVKHISTLYVVPRGEGQELLEKQVQRFPDLNIVFLGNHEFEDLSSTDSRKK